MHLKLFAYVYSAMYSTINFDQQPTFVNSRLECASLCYRQANCTSFFYWSGQCHPTENMYVTSEQNIQSSGPKYFVWGSDECTQNYIWYRILGLCYRVSTHYLSWQDAENQCESEGGHLITVDSPELYDFMVRLVTSFDTTPWIGGKTFNGTDWLWADGSPSDVIFWDDDEPYGHPNRCTIFNKDSKMLRDKSCTEFKRFVCSLPVSTMILC